MEFKKTLRISALDLYRYIRKGKWERMGVGEEEGERVGAGEGQEEGQGAGQGEGHWQGDPECPKGISGERPPHQQGTPKQPTSSHFVMMGGPELVPAGKTSNCIGAVQTASTSAAAGSNVPF